MDRARTAGDLWDRVLALAEGLEEPEWSRPTPCQGWSVHDLLAHLSGIQVGFDSGHHEPPPEGWEPDPTQHPLDAWTEAGVRARRSWTRQALLEELRAARAGHVARLAAVRDWSAPADGPVGRTTEDGLFQVRMFDLWVHLQDLRAALDRPLETDDTSAAAAAAHRYVFALVPWMWVKRAGAREHATMRLAFGPPLGVDTVVEVSLGRGRLNPDADPGRCALTGSPAGLTLLATGRREPEALRDAGLLDWSGKRAQEFVTRARLF